MAMVMDCSGWKSVEMKSPSHFRFEMESVGSSAGKWTHVPIRGHAGGPSSSSSPTPNTLPWKTRTVNLPIKCQQFLRTKHYNQHQIETAARDVNRRKRLDIVAVELVVTFTPTCFAARDSPLEFPLLELHNLRALIEGTTTPYESVGLSDAAALLLTEFPDLQTVYQGYFQEPDHALRERLLHIHAYLWNPTRAGNTYYWKMRCNKHGAVLMDVFPSSIEYLTWMVDKGEDLLPRMMRVLERKINVGICPIHNLQDDMKREFGHYFRIERHGDGSLKEIGVKYDLDRATGEHNMSSYEKLGRDPSLVRDLVKFEREVWDESAQAI